MTSEDEPSSPPAGAAAGPTAAARALGERGDWAAAYELLCRADERGELDARGLEFCAECARWVGHNERVVEFQERAHQAHADDPRGAARTALGLCYTHMDACEAALAASWWRRADELIAALPEGPEHGLHAWYAGRAQGAVGDIEGHGQHAHRALEIAQRHGDRNVEALALIDLGHVAAVRGQSSQALELLDRATALALGGEIGVLETGIVFCNAIYACRARGEWDRAEEWTHSASRWVARVQVSYFPGLCRVHRAEVLRIRGELTAAESEALEAVRLLGAAIPRWIALAHIELGEVRRRLGDLAGAYACYRLARGAGWDPQPGFALVLLAQGDAPAAHRALERFRKSRMPTLSCEDRTGLLRARVTVALAAGEMEAARAAWEELDALASEDSSLWDVAACTQAAGELALARGDAASAVEHLHEARTRWAELDAPFELATACALLGRSLAADGDALGARLELEAARGIFERLGAKLDREACESWLAGLEDDPASESAARVRPETTSEARPRRQGEASLRREGESWSIDFEGAEVRLKHSLGLDYLARLLESPGRVKLALELTGIPSGLAAQGDAGEILDAEARAAYRARLADLRADLEEADGNGDLGRSERCRAELDLLASQLAAAVGLGGRARRAGDPGERARQSVTKAIRGTIRRIADVHEPLGRYLSNTIRTGLTCGFDPDPGRPIRWRVDA